MAEVAVQKGDMVAVRDAFDEWHPAIAESGVVRKGVRFPLVHCTLPLRGWAIVPFPAEDVLLLTEATAASERTLRQVVDEPPQPDAVLQVPFHALRHGERVLVTAVLERTAVYGSDQEKELDRLEAFVPDEELAWVLAEDKNRSAGRRGREMASFGRRRRPGGRLPGSRAG